MTNDLKKLNRQIFKDIRFGMFIHWGLYSMTGKDMWYYSREEVEKKDYERLFNRFDPVYYDPQEWAQLARKAGMKYAVFTTKHHDGFCLWDTQYTNFKVTNTPFGKDVLRMWVDAFRTEGIKIGFYYSLLDWHHPHFTVDYCHPAKKNMDTLNEGRDFNLYIEFMHNQIRELLTLYKDVFVLWPDFSYGEVADLPGKHGKDWKASELIQMIHELQPGILVNNRLGIMETDEIPMDFKTPEQQIPTEDLADDGKSIAAWETCDTIGSSWGYYRGDTSIKSVSELVRRLVTCVSNNGNLLLNVGPTAKGKIQPEFIDRLSEIGKWIELNGESIYGAGSSRCKLSYCVQFEKTAVFTQRGKHIYLHCFDTYPPYDLIIRNVEGTVDYVETLSDGTDIAFEEIEVTEITPVDVSKKTIKLRMPILIPDPYDTVIHIALI